MGWRDFQTTPPREFMEFMESMPIATPLIPLIPLIPVEPIKYTAPQFTKFEQEGDPVTCPYWNRVCHFVGLYQDACTRCTDCEIFKFLEANP